MKIKRMVKRLFAVGSGATMLAATAMGAMAADLSTYPDMFVTDGTFNGFFVVGENSAPVDNLAMTDIAASMKTTKVGTGATTTTVEGDAWLVQSGEKKFEIANSNASVASIGTESFRDIVTFIGEDELAALADGKWATNENEYAYQQFLFFDEDMGDTSVSRIVKYTEDDADVTADHLFIKSGRQIGRYKLEFGATAQSDVTDSTGAADTTGTYVWDFENTDLSVMGRDYSVVQARRTNVGADANAHGLKLTLMSGSTRDTLLEGETKTYTVGEKTYEVTLSYVDSTYAKFTVNGESTNKLQSGDTYVLSDKSEVGVSEVLYQSYAGGIHSSTFFVGASKMVLQDDDVLAGNANGAKLKVGSEEIDGSLVSITGTDNNVTFSVSTIEINMSADDDYFVGADGKLSDVIAAAGEEKEVLMNGAFDVEYKGMTKEVTHDIGLKASGGRKYTLDLYDGDNNLVHLPIAYAESASNLTVGADTGVATRNNQKRLILYEQYPIYKGDYFVLTAGTASDGSAKSYLLQYKGSDKSTDTSPKIRFKNEGSGETLEYAATTAAAGGVIATIKTGGYSFDVISGVSMHADGAQTADDYAVWVALDTTSPTFAAAGNASGYGHISFVDSYGSQWFTNITLAPGSTQGITSLNGTSYNTLGGNAAYTNVSAVVVAVTVPNSNDYDNVVPSTFSFNVTPTTGPEVNANILTTGSLTGQTVNPVTLVTPSGETEIAYGYTSMGAFITHNNPSSDPDEFTFAYPEKQQLPQVYFTSGATTTSSTSSGDLTAVTVVDATKLDSEIASTTAQNLIVVGGPCVNTVAAELLGSPADCVSGFTPGKARVKLFEHANGNMAMLVAGYTGADTRLAGKVLAHRWSEFSGDEVEIEGTTYSDATIGAPMATPVVTEEAVADETTTE